MKKRILVLSAVLMIIATLLALTACTPPTKSDSEPIATLLRYDSYEMLEKFVTAFPKRTSGADDGKDEEAATYLYTEMLRIDPSLSVAIRDFTYINDRHDKRTERGYNVIARKSASVSTDKTVVIGAYYDNLNGEKINGSIVESEGVYDNAGSVIALLQTVDAMRELKLDYNIEYVAFAAGNVGFSGSMHYLSETRDDIVLMINYNQLVGGEYLYYYTGEVESLHGKIAGETSESLKLDMTKAPKYAFNVGGQYIENSHLGYYTPLMLGDHISFMNNGINILSITSANFGDYSSTEHKEFKGKPNIAGTSADTLLTVVDRLGGGEAGKSAINKIVNQTVTLTQTYLTRQGFIDDMIKSRETRFDYSVFGDIRIMMYIGYGLMAAMLLTALILYFALKGKAKPHPVIRMTPYGPVDIHTGEIKGTAETKEKIDPFDEDFGSTDGSKEEEQPKIKDVGSSDIFEDF